MKLEVAKTVVGEENVEQLFEFEIQIRQDNSCEWSEPFTFELSHDLAFEFTVPYGYQYRISEEDYSDEGYRTFVMVEGKKTNQSVCEGTMLFSRRIEYINEKIGTEQLVDKTVNVSKQTVAFVGVTFLFLLVFVLIAIKRKLQS